MNIIFNKKPNNCKTFTSTSYLFFYSFCMCLTFAIGLSIFIKGFLINPKLLLDGILFQNIKSVIIVYPFIILYSILATFVLLKLMKNDYLFINVFSFVNKIPKKYCENYLKSIDFGESLNNSLKFEQLQLNIYEQYTNTNTSSFILKKLKKI